VTEEAVTVAMLVDLNQVLCF